jgi:hypothetical protein
MSSTEAPISITVKTPVGSLVTVRGETGEDLDLLVATGLASISSAVTELEAIVRGAQAAPLTQASNIVAQALGATPIHQDIPPFNPAPSITGGRNCPHGKMTAIQGASKQGGVYKGYFCPSAQGDPTKCKTQYLDKSNAEWNTFVPDHMK